MSTIEQTECDCDNHGDCNFCLDRDYPALSPLAMEHFVETGCAAGDEPGHLSDSVVPERLIGMSNEFSSHTVSPKTGTSMSNLSLVPAVQHNHSWSPVPNECGIYSCACGWFGLREPIDGSITARPTLRLVKRLIWQCYGCNKMTDKCDEWTQLCPACTAAKALQVAR